MYHQWQSSIYDAVWVLVSLHLHLETFESKLNGYFDHHSPWWSRRVDACYPSSFNPFFNLKSLVGLRFLDSGWVKSFVEWNWTRKKIKKIKKNQKPQSGLEKVLRSKRGLYNKLKSEAWSDDLLVLYSQQVMIMISVGLFESWSSDWYSKVQ